MYRVCYSFLGNPAESEDAVQETFIKLARSGVVFEDQEHEKAWLIRVATNQCKDMLRRSSRSDAPLDKLMEQGRKDPEYDATLDVVMTLEPKYRIVIYLHYYEGYTLEEIAKILDKPSSTVRNHIGEARKILKKELGGDWR